MDKSPTVSAWLKVNHDIEIWIQLLMLVQIAERAYPGPFCPYYEQCFDYKDKVKKDAAWAEQAVDLSAIARRLYCGGTAV